MKKFIIFGLAIFGLSWSGQSVWAAYGDVSTYLGRSYGGDGGQALSANFDFPEDVVVDASGNLIVADTANHVIRKIATDGIVTTLAGNGSYGNSNGAATSAEFASPRGVATDTNGNTYVADSENGQIRKIDRYGAVTALASGLSNPQGVEVYGGYVYIADTGSNSIKRVPAAGGEIQNVASNLNAPKKISIDTNGSFIYVADSGSHKVKRVARDSGDVVDVAGSGTAAYAEGTGASASFNNIWGVEYYNGKLYVTDGDGYTDRLRSIDLATSTTSLLAQDAVMATLNYPSGLVVSNNYIYVANSGIGTIRRFNLTDPSNLNQDIAGATRFNNFDGAAAQVMLGRPWDMVLSPDRQWLYLAENNKIRRINYATKEASHFIGSVVDNYIEGDSSHARFSNITSLAINSTGSTLYLTDRWNNRIRQVDLGTAHSSLIAGGGLTNSTGEENNGYVDGVGDAARFNKPAGVVISPDDKYLYVSDAGNNRIRRVNLANGETSLIAGSGVAGFLDGAPGDAKFNKPYGLALDSNGENLYVADTNNHVIRKIKLADNTVSTLVGTGSAGYNDAIGRRAVFSYPEYVKIDSMGNLYISEAGSHRIRLIEKSTLATKLVAGSGQRGFKNGTRASAEFNNPKGLLVDIRASLVLVADANNDIIRQINIQGTAPFTEAAPEASRVNPNVISLSWDKGNGLRVNIFGKNFRHGAVVKFGQLDVIKTYVVKSTELVIELPVKQMRSGWYDVSVTNSDGQTASLSRGLGIKGSNGQVPNVDHYLDETGSFYAYASQIRGGYFTASGNVTGTVAAEIVVGTEQGLGPQVRVFDSAGTVKAQFFAYAQTLRSGVRVATCDTNGDGYDEIITVPGKGGRPHVRIFNGKGTPIGSGFFALDGKFTGGANIACGDVNGDGRPEVIVAAGPGGGPHVTVHKADGTMITNFMAYDKNFRGGIVLAAIDLDGNGTKEIVTAPEKGAPHLQMFTGKGRRINPGIYAFDRNFGGGLAIAGGDVDGDGLEEILVTPGSPAQTLLKIYKNSGQTLSKSFYLYSKTFTGAARISSGDVNGDGLDEIIAVPYSNSSPMVKIYNQNGALTE